MKNIRKVIKNMKNMQIFEPAMCCASGLCGVGVDQELLRITTMISNLKSKGIMVDRFNLSNDPQEFVSNNIVNTYLQDKGVDGLPVILLERDIIIAGRYPTNEEFTSLLQVTSDVNEEN